MQNKVDYIEIPLTRRVLHEQVADRIRDLITEGHLEPGAKLNERVLCEELGVSRTPLREALKQLAGENLIDLHVNRGASVASLEFEQAEQLFELMAGLEGLSGALAAERRTEAELIEIEALHLEMLAAHRRTDLPNYYRLNRQIHAAINACTRNRILEETYQRLNGRLQSLRFRSNFDTAKWDAAVREHSAMITALRARDSKALREILEAHLLNKRDAVLEQWNQIRSAAQGAA